ncbi:MAG: hypothetical protein U0804_24175 [Gemmataceae bacterium]
MTVRKLLTGFVAVAGLLAFTTDAQAFGKRKKNKGCDTCASAAPASTGCGGCGVAYAGTGAAVAVAPEAMPATGTATTTTPATVTPVTGTTTGVVVPAGYSTVVEQPDTTTRARRGILRR